MNRNAARQAVRRPWLPWAALGCLLAGASLVLALLAIHSLPSEHPAVQVDEPMSSVAPAQPGAWGPSAQPGVAQAVRPQHLTIPSIGVSTDLVRLGLQADRSVEVPQDPARAGWFDRGPAPGQLGSSVVLGHVDSVEGPAVFYRLSELRRGDRIQVGLSDGSLARFAVRRVATYANNAFPAHLVYAGAAGHRALNLVTCGGWYDADLGGWQGNVVVFAELVGGPPAA